MATETKENYLKGIYFLDQQNKDVSITALANQMQVSKPTVSDMVKKLELNGWLEYKRYKPLRLTAKGRKTAALIIRKHRLTEMFLVQVMGFGWEEVHDIAEEVEHINSIKFFDRMDDILGFPATDPHGSPIPDKEGNTSKLNLKLLSNLKVGDQVVLRGLRDSSKEFLLYLNKNNLLLGTKIMVIQIEPFDASFTVTISNNDQIQLSNTITNKLLVEEIV